MFLNEDLCIWRPIDFPRFSSFTRYFLSDSMFQDENLESEKDGKI